MSIERGRKLRDEAIRRVTIGNPEWILRATILAYTYARQLPVGSEFTTDRVWYECRSIPPPREPRAMAAVMRALAKRFALIEPTDRTVQSTRPLCHVRPIRIWRRK